MSLIMMSTTNGILEAIGIGAEAVSTTVTQDTGGNISESVKDVITYPIPDMTSNTTPSGVASSNYEHSLGGGYYLYAWNAFDRDSVSYWLGLAVGHYLQYQSPTPMGIDKYDIASRSNSSSTPPRGWDIHVSNDGVNWTLVDSQSNQSFTYGEVKTYTLAQSVVATYIKLTVVTLDAIGQANISEFRPYGFNSDVDILKTTTPIADGDVLIIEKEDGSFNEIVASGVAGNTPYTMDTSAITLGEVPAKVYLASTFQKDFQVVRNISMDLEFGNIADSLTENIVTDIMTGYTNPSGAVVTGSGNSSIYAQEWMVFDRTTDDRWWTGTNDSTEEWVNYELPTAQIVHKYIMRAETYSASEDFPPAWEIQGSNDGITYTTLDTQSNQNLLRGEFKEYNISSPDSYKHYRWWKVNAGKTNIQLGGIEYISVDGVVDTLRTTHEIVDGDKLIIVKDDDSINEITASGVASEGLMGQLGADISTSVIGANEVDVVHILNGIALNPDGTRVFALVGDSKIIQEYSLATPYDFSTIALVREGTDATLPNTLFGLEFSPDGTKLFTLERYSGLKEYALGTAWDITSGLTLLNTLAITADTIQYNGGLTFNPDGTKLIISARNTTKVYEVLFPTPYSLVGASVGANQFSHGSLAVYGSTVTSCGTRMVLSFFNSSSVILKDYILSTPWDVSTAVLNTTITDGTTYQQSKSIVVDPIDGSRLFLLARNKSNLYRIISAGVAGGLNAEVVTQYSLDTSLITIGQVPSRVFKLDAGVAFNNKLARYPVDTLAFGTTLTSTRTFDEVAVSGRALETKVTLGKGNKMIGLTADVYRKA